MRTDEEMKKLKEEDIERHKDYLSLGERTEQQNKLLIDEINRRSKESE